MRSNYRVAWSIYSYHHTIVFTVPVFSFAADPACCICNKPATETDYITVRQTEIFFDPFPAHLCSMQPVNIIKKELWTVQIRSPCKKDKYEKKN